MSLVVNKLYSKVNYCIIGRQETCLYSSKTKRGWDGLWDSHMTMKYPKDISPISKGDVYCLLTLGYSLMLLNIFNTLFQNTFAN